MVMASPPRSDEVLIKPVVFTDLDGTLLDQVDHSFAQAAEALGRIRSKGIPLVLCSSKTRAEIEHIRAKLSNNDPFISENGGGVFIPPGYFPFPIAGERAGGYISISLGRSYREVREALACIRSGIAAKVTGFGDLSKEEIAGLTGLTLHEAELSKKRDFDEPFIFEGGREAEDTLARKLMDKGFSCTRGRLFHAAGAHDKGTAVRILKGYYEKLYGGIITIGLGDRRNDEPIFKESDYAVLVKKADGRYEDMDVPGLVMADGAGPAGWNKAVSGILDSIEASQTGYRC